MSVSELKTHALRVIERIASTGEAVTITKRGKPVATILPISAPPTLLGSVRVSAPGDLLVDPIDEPWDADR